MILFSKVSLKKYTFLLLFTLFIGLRSVAAVSVDGRWVLHPSLDINSYLYPTYSEATNNVQRLFDSDRYLYALITGNYFEEKSQDYYINSPLIAARFDKQSPAEGMQPLATRLDLSGLNVDAMEYNRQQKCLVIAYDNKAVDFIFDNGRILSNKDLTDINRPGGSRVRSISFSADGTRTVLATDFGILIIDSATAKTTSLLNLRHNIDYANVLPGNRIIASNKSGIRICGADTIAARFDSIAPLRSTPEMCPKGLLSADSTILLKAGIFPVGNDAFLFLGANTSSNSEGVSLNLLFIPSGSQSSPVVETIIATGVNYNQMGLNSVHTKAQREAALLSPTRDGLMLHTSDKIYLIDLNPLLSESITPENIKVLISRLVTTLDKPSAPSPNAMTGREAYKQCASADGMDFYFFVPRQGFQLRRADTISSQTKWSNLGDIITVNAPLAGMPSHLYYNPKHGIVVHNRGRNTDNIEFKAGLTDGLCTYADGHWTTRSLATLNPEHYFSGNNPIIYYPAGGVHDPLDPDHIFTTGRTQGLRRQNLSDPGDVLLLTRNNYLPDYAGHVTVVNLQTGSSYPTLCSFGHPDFDSDGTMWTSFSRRPSTEFPDAQAELWYWTAADRQAVKSASDYESHPMRKIIIPGILGSQFATIHTPRLATNRNIIVHVSGTSDIPTFFYDHNGTLDDTTDDRLVILKDALDGNDERKLDFVNPRLFLEDPYDGHFIIGTVDGLITTSRSQIFDGKDMRFRWLRPVNRVGGLYYDFGRGGITGITVDGEQRKWITLSTGSLVCLAADRSEVLAEFTPDNSSLPSSTLLGVTYNPATNSIFVGTDRGIAEFILSGTFNALSTPEPAIYPAVVEPDYVGHITITGLIDTQTYTLLAPSGDKIILPKSVNGVTQFDPQGLSSGYYRLLSHPAVECLVLGW